jgi:hypothetical protein
MNCIILFLFVFFTNGRLFVCLIQLGRHERTVQHQPQSVTLLSSYFITQVISFLKITYYIYFSFGYWINNQTIKITLH